MREIRRMLKALGRPRFDWLQVEVSAVCNASCAYCVPNCCRDAWQGGLMAMETFTCLEPHFRNADLVFLQGWGEPLLHPQFWEMARRAKAAGARVGFTTNGTRLHGDNLARLLDIPIDTMGVSIAGTTAATSDRWRAGNDFARIGAALQEFKGMKRARGGEATQVHIAYMLLASNWPEIEGLPALAEAWGASQVVVNNLSFIADPALEQESLFERPDLWPQVLKMLESVLRHASERSVALHYYRPDTREPHAVCSENVLKACFVSWQGDVGPCVLTNHNIREGSTATHFFRARAYPVERFVYGNVNRRTFDAIWHSTEARAFRAAFERRLERIRPGAHDLPAPCRHCYKLFEP